MAISPSCDLRVTRVASSRFAVAETSPSVPGVSDEETDVFTVGPAGATGTPPKSETQNQLTVRRTAPKSWITSKAPLSPVTTVITPAAISEEHPRSDTDTLGGTSRDAAINNDMVVLGSQDALGTLEAGLYLENSCLLSPLNTPSDFDAYFSSNLASSSAPDDLPLMRSGDGDFIQPTEPETLGGPSAPVFGLCGCMTRAAHQIALISCDIPAAGQAWFQEQLSRIRQATIAAEDCISCHCVSYDDSTVCTMSPTTSTSISCCLDETDVTTPQ
ncbi:hypothetical protein PG988_006331 [Apiospora saccharicola]